MKPSNKPNEHTRLENGLPTEGWGPYCYQWLSICSGHGRNADGNYYNFNVDCTRCMSGEWINSWETKIENFIYETDPKLWRWWVNRPSLIPAIQNLFWNFSFKYKDKNK